MENSNLQIFKSTNNFRILKFRNLDLFGNWKLEIGNFRLEAGYTLIEILVALTIIGLLFGVGYANFRGFSRRQSILNVAKSMQGDLRLTQEKALAGQKPDDASCSTPENSLNGYFFTIKDSESYEIRASCSGVNPPPATKTVTLATDVAFASPFPSPNPILFRVLGNGTNIPSGQSVTITIKQVGTTNQSVVTISSGGQIQ